MKAEQGLQQIQISWKFIEEAIAIITTPANKERYSFLVYNTSITTWQLIRPFV